LKGRIRSLEAERLRLKNELENLRRTAENRAMALEEDVSVMREELNELREILGPNATTLPTKVEQIQKTNPVTTVMTEASAKESSPSSPSPVPAKTTLDSAMDNLSEDELRVVKILQAHDGKYPQKAIRTEARLSWLQANRIVTRLNEQGIISFEKDGPLENVVLAEELKSNS
jgi:uncharacterized membrane protein